METIEENQNRLGIQTVARWLLTWLFVQTMIFGAVAWFVSYQVLIRGAELSYYPPYQEAASKKGK